MSWNPDDENPFDDIFDGSTPPSNPTASDEMEPVDVHEYDEQIMVVTDIPGIEEEDVTLQCDGRTLSIYASTGTRQFVATVSLPAYVDEESVQERYNNGVLEVTLDRAPDPANIGFY